LDLCGSESKWMAMKDEFQKAVSERCEPGAV
jgi:hypothetical protein